VRAALEGIKVQTETAQTETLDKIAGVQLGQVTKAVPESRAADHAPFFRAPWRR
jgi:hypothetical protein